MKQWCGTVAGVFLMPTKRSTDWGEECGTRALPRIPLLLTTAAGSFDCMDDGQTTSFQILQTRAISGRCRWRSSTVLSS